VLGLVPGVICRRDARTGDVTTPACRTGFEPHRRHPYIFVHVLHGVSSKVYLGRQSQEIRVKLEDEVKI
jgi:hypothetical protein